MASHFLSFESSQAQQSPKGSSLNTCPPLPSRIVLAFLGIVYPQNEVVSNQSIPMTAMDYGTVNDDDGEERCQWMSMDPEDDEASLIIHDDKNNNIDEETPSMWKRWKGISWFDMFLVPYLSTSCCFMMFDFTSYVHAYWGKKQQTLHFVSYFTFLVQIMVVPYWCLYSRLKFPTMTLRGCHWVSTLSKAFIARRINIIREWRSDAKSLSWLAVFCTLALPVTTGCLRVVYDYVFRICMSERAHIEISHWNSLLGFVVYGCFCYVIYLERRSFEIEARLIYRYAMKQERGQSVDRVLYKIRLFSLQYRVLRKQIGKWMAFTMVVSSWGLTSHITWNYWVFSDQDLDPDVLRTVYALNALITSEKITFILVPYVVLGGLNIDYIWIRFKEDIAHCRQYKYVQYWKAINSYVKDINTQFSGDLTATLVSSAVGVYLGLNLSKTQNVGFWNGANGCNYTDNFFLVN